MSNEHNYCTTKDLGKAIAIIAFIMIGIPMMIVMSYDDYPKYCKMSIVVPCIGVLINDTDG
jgi:hypothetical protein|tara:strand:- start:30 stop:212 length:183 start_codon:yes stop_codon:yes gene_type:complete